MKKFRIVFDKIVYGAVIVDANNMEEAIEKAEDMPVQTSEDMLDYWRVYKEICQEIE